MGERRPLNGAKKVVLCGLMASTLTVLKMVLSPLPNIEPVSLLILVYALVFGRQVLSIILPFVVVEGLLYGFNPMWWLGYLYVWPLWGLICTKLPPGRPLLLAMASGTFGLAFPLWQDLVPGGGHPLVRHKKGGGADTGAQAAADTVFIYMGGHTGSSLS